jgi:hypothetical protein
MLHSEEVSIPITINIKQYLSTNHFLVNNRHFVIKYSQTTQLYITKVFEKNSVVASTSVVNEHVIKPSVKLRQLDIKLLQ